MLTPTDNRMAVYKKVITPSKSNPYENETYPLSQTVGKVHKSDGVAGNVGKALGYIKIQAEGFAKYGNSQSTPHNAGSFGDDPSAASDVNGASLSAAVPLYQVIEHVQIWCQDIRTGAVILDHAVLSILTHTVPLYPPSLMVCHTQPHRIR
jgi:hypothetical protein